MNKQEKQSLGLRLNLMVLWLTRHWLRVALVVIGLYAGLPYLTPVLMKAGLTGPASALYTLYSPFCHQFAFRSFFLFGEQVVYPRYNTGMPLTPFEAYAEDLPQFAPDRLVTIFGVSSPVQDIYAFTPGYQAAAREFVGNEQMGYKMTLCQRDVAIYTALFIGVVIYTRIGRRLRPVPLWLYVLLGLTPIALDGVSQLIGYLPPPYNLWPPRETLPGFRVLTGALFGLMNAWLGLPYLDMSMRETQAQILAKLERAGVRL